MPIHKGFDYYGRYYQYGNVGKRYYFRGPDQEGIAYNMALAQARAIRASQSRLNYH